MKLEFSRQIFEKHSNIKFHENPSSVNRVVPCGQTDRHDEVSSSSLVALKPWVGLGLLYNTPPGLSIPCSVSPFVYSHLSQVRGHVIQPSHFWSSSSSCSIQLSVQHLFGIAGMTKLMVVYRNFANASKICTYDIYEY